jgi:membrane protein DedA with SNARE-associated domain/rhodanese-related sulfurtransferase
MPSQLDYVWIVWINALLHELGVPVPMLPTVLLAGASGAGAGGAAPLALIAAVVAGTVIGNAVWFQAGRLHGVGVLRLLCRLSLSPDTCVARTEGTFMRWGASSLVVGRFIPGVSLIAPPLAGALGMPWWKFLALTTAGASLWGLAAVGAGMLLADQIDALVDALSRYGIWAVAVVVVALAGYMLWRWGRRWRALRAARLPRIQVAELRAAIEQGEAPLIVDVRGAATRQAMAHRIPGTHEVTLDDALAGRPDLPRDRLLVVHCSCPNEISAALAARRLIEVGFRRARPLAGGLEAWVAAGYAVEPAADGARAPASAREAGHDPGTPTGRA